MQEDYERCTAFMAFGDDHGYNFCTFRCQLDQGHPGPHSEMGVQDNNGYSLYWTTELETERKSRP
jgi:hypothetical protein